MPLHESGRDGAGRGGVELRRNLYCTILYIFQSLLYLSRGWSIGWRGGGGDPKDKVRTSDEEGRRSDTTARDPTTPAHFSLLFSGLTRLASNKALIFVSVTVILYCKIWDESSLFK